MSGPDPGAKTVDEFDWIQRCLIPLAAGSPGALGLLDDAAIIPARPGFDLVLSKDAIVSGVHFLPDDPLDEVARKLLRVNLSDLAAKGAEPYAYMLAIAWPPSADWPAREAFARGLGEDQRRFGLTLLGGDTVSTLGPLTASLTIFGYVPSGRLVPRGGARPGDLVLVSGTIGDGALGLQAAQGRLAGLDQADLDWLAGRYRRPEPRLNLRPALRDHVHAAADVSDGLVADAGRLAIASGLALELDLAAMPLSPPARRWLALQPDPVAARLALATGGDDYEVICTAALDEAQPLCEAASTVGTPLTVIGCVTTGQGVVTRHGREALSVARAGYRHS
ncbi:MAG: thiamine-phosphate kinase [Caulobacteraceae bacterium]|nr:thiamine-phosphate kinase [Caulobacteraceae bacterium]